MAIRQDDFGNGALVPVCVSHFHRDGLSESDVTGSAPNFSTSRSRYSALSDTTLPQRRPPYVGIPFNQAKAEGRPRIGFRRQMVADGGRWWDFAQIPPAGHPQAVAASSLRRNVASAGPTGGLGAKTCSRWANERSSRPRNHPEYRPPNRPQFAEPARKPCRNRPESAKTIRKTVIRVVKPLNKVPNFGMFDTHATSLLFDWPSRTRAWHFSGLDSPLVRNPRHPGGNHPRRTLASIRRGSGAPQTRRDAPSSPPPAN